MRRLGTRWGLASAIFLLLGVLSLAMSLRSGESMGGVGGVLLRPFDQGDDTFVGQIAGHEPVEDDGIINSIEELHEVYGEPPDATFGRMRIPALGIDAPLGTRYVAEDGVMLDPTGPDDVVYYDFSGWNGLGGYPTSGGNAVFAGHVDQAGYLWYADAEYIGPAVFYNLRNLGGGETVEIDLGSGPVTYIVDWVREVGPSENWTAIVSANVEADSITLITCGGEFNRAEGAYTARTVVRAVRAG
ncbi:MAG: class F sortase [Dehalococcoidia bacterium]